MIRISHTLYLSCFKGVVHPAVFKGNTTHSIKSQGSFNQISLFFSQIHHGGRILKYSLELEGVFQNTSWKYFEIVPPAPGTISKSTLELEGVFQNISRKYFEILPGTRGTFLQFYDPIWSIWPKVTHLPPLNQPISNRYRSHFLLSFDYNSLIFHATDLKLCMIVPNLVPSHICLILWPNHSHF